MDPNDGSVSDTYRRDVAIYTHPELAETDREPGQEIYVMYSDGRIVALRATGG